MTQLCFPIEDITSVAATRREILQLAARQGFDDGTIARLAVVVTEAATNIVKHAQSGELLVQPRADDSGGVFVRHGFEIIALDRDEGIADLDSCMRDGVSTAGTAGSGLGAMRRLCSEFEIYTQPGKGTVVYMAVFAGAAPPSQTLQIGAVSLPKAGEDCCGDAWHLQKHDGFVLLAVADGLGHGPDAAAAARMALSVLANGESSSPFVLLNLAHLRARPTRGAAVSIAALGLAPQLIRYAGVGNIVCCIGGDGPRRQVLNSNGTIGHRLQKIHEVEVEWPIDSLIIMHSDGISTQWDLRSYPGLITRHPLIIAAVLYRDFSRHNDDATVVVLKRASGR